MILSHDVNAAESRKPAAGFRLVGKYFPMTVAETFQTWSVCETLIAVAAQLLATQPISALGAARPLPPALFNFYQYK